MPRTTNLGFRVGQDLKDAIERAAAAGDRSVSRQVERYLREALMRDGFLSAEPAAPRKAPRKRPAARLDVQHGLPLTMRG